jgi:hypothetical protein
VRSESPPTSVKAAVFMMLALSAVWASIGAIIALELHPAMHLPRPWNMLMGGLMLAAALVALGLVLLLRRRSRVGFCAALAFLAASILAVVFDDVGWTDLMFVAVNVIPVILLLRARLWYLRP